MVDEFVGRDGLSEKTFDSGGHQAIQSIALNEPGAEKNGNVATDFPQPLESFLTIHERHRQIEQNELEGMRLSPEKIERLETRLRCNNVISSVGQQAFHQNERHLLIVDDQNALLWSRHFGDRLRLHE